MTEALKEDLTQIFGILVSNDKQTILSNIKTLAGHHKNILATYGYWYQHNHSQAPYLSDFCDEWEKQASDPLSFVDVSIRAIPSDA